MNINGNLNIKGSVTSTGDMVAGGISQINHKHGKCTKWCEQNRKTRVMNRQTGEVLTDETAHIKQSIADILLTAKGSRVMRRDYGSNLYRLIDRPISSGLLLQLSCACVMALKQWEPRIIVNRFLIRFDAEKSRFLGTLEATIKRSNTKFILGDLAL